MSVRLFRQMLIIAVVIQIGNIDDIFAQKSL